MPDSPIPAVLPTPPDAPPAVPPSATVRAAVPADVPDLLAMICELAVYEREPHAVEATEALLHAALFGSDPVAGCLVAVPETGPALLGMALWFRTFSTWVGRPGVHLEDLYVRDAHRRTGVGRALLAALAALVDGRGWGRLEWSVLDWNTDAQAFYRSLGAEPVAGWTTFRLTGAALHDLGAAAPVEVPGPSR